jgi:hypothetical protein
MANQASNKIKYLLATKAIDFANDAFKIILMQSGFTFNKDTHEKYADVSASELGTAYGYTVKTKALAGVAVTEDDTDDRCEVTWNDPAWTASGGDIGPTPGAIIIDDTVTDDPIVGYIDFGGDVTQANGGTLTLNDVEFRIA